MARPIMRITPHTLKEKWIQQSRSALARLESRDLARAGEDGVIRVSPEALRRDLDADERSVVYRLLGYVQDPACPLIAKRAGVVGGRAAIAGRRMPVWQVYGRVRDGERPEAVAAELDLTMDQIVQAITYAEAHADEIRQDVLDQEWAQSHVGEGTER